MGRITLTASSKSGGDLLDFMRMTGNLYGVTASGIDERVGSGWLGLIFSLVFTDSGALHNPELALDICLFQSDDEGLTGIDNVPV